MRRRHAGRAVLAGIPDELLYFDALDWHPDEDRAHRLWSEAFVDWCRLNRVNESNALAAVLSVPSRPGGRLEDDWHRFTSLR